MIDQSTFNSLTAAREDLDRLLCMEETFWKQKSRCLFATSSRRRMLLSNGEAWFAADVPLLSLCRLGEQFHSRSFGFTIGMARKMWLYLKAQDLVIY
jgi:hypothetical protein